MAKKPEPPKRVSKITIPDRCHPLAKVVFAEMRRQSMTYDELEYVSGVLRSTVKAWRKDNRPGLDTMEAALGTLGWSLLPVPLMKHVPDNVKSILAQAAGQWEDENALLCQLMATVSRAPIVAMTGQTEGVVAMIKPKRRAGRIHPDQARLFDEVAA